MSQSQHTQQPVSGLASWSDVLPPIDKRISSVPASEDADEENLTPSKKTPRPVKCSKPRAKKPRRAIPEDKAYIPEEEQPSPADVVGGRGGRSNHHPGNRPYWIRILASRQAYRFCESDSGKCQIAQDILDFVKARGGRFLNLDDATKRWFLLPDSVVLDKVKQALRDRYVPYWAKNMDIKPLVINNTQRTLPVMGIITDQQHHSILPPRPAGIASMATPSSYGLLHRHQQNNLDFLLAATRAYGGAPAREVIPSLDDALKCKIDTLPPFDQRQRAAAAAAAAAQTPFMASLGMGNSQLFDFMSSLSGGAGSLATGNIGGNVVNTASMSNAIGSFGGHFGGPFGGPMAGNFGSSAAMNSVGASLALRSLELRSLDRFLDNQTFNASSSRSLSLMNLMASQGGFGSLGGVGGLHLPPGPSGGMDATATVRSFSAAASGGLSSSTGGKNGCSKTDWNAMFAKALGNAKAG